MLPRSLHNVLHAARDYLTPTLKSTQFLERGQLTPEEFVIAGDYLARLSPGWKWCSGEARLAKTYLPPDKQFLVSRDCICRRRAVFDVSGEETDEGEGWTRTGRDVPAEEYEDMPDVGQRILHVRDELADFMDSTLMTIHDPSVAMIIPETEEGGDRLYDIYIVYDNAYRTPRIYMSGTIASCGMPLRPESMMEDLMQDYVAKTATLEKHPHVGGGQFVSIHPCRHAQTMKRLVDEMSTVGGGAPSIELYMFIFLKFISSVIPTIEYDLTMAVSISA